MATINLPAIFEKLLSEQARARDMTPEQLAHEILRANLLSSPTESQPVVQPNRWALRLPSNRNDSPQMLDQMARCKTIAVVGDIRNSQELMVYSPGATEFAKRLALFMKTTEEAIRQNFGVFDSFMGDGFMAFFNELACQENGLNYRDAFLKFAREELEFCASHFSEWISTLSKTPGKPIGLALGADVGTVNFLDVDGFLIATGSPVVWAARMSMIGSADEIVVGNLLHSCLPTNPELSFETRLGRTKIGECFSSFRLSFT